MPSWPLTSRPDLRPLFGEITEEVQDRLLDLLCAIDERLARLATEASAHVGVPYKALPLELWVRPHDAEISGGPSGEAGDIWFEIGFTLGTEDRHLFAPPWAVESRLIVFCDDRPEPRGEPNTHSLVRLVAATPTPFLTVQALDSQVEAIAAALHQHDPHAYTQTPHAKLP